ncbi:energy transducer TonB [Acidipila rosea]|uniref:TonB-like protein n=1 Tax=Acidipila rosea TaxID=768535 RepID=A0A4R1L4B9_9BACT|nr:energy transducer TonB [Acidipila rosea]TCK71947.1 TonB-like protein [Acidipila rosea]
MIDSRFLLAVVFLAPLACSAQVMQSLSLTRAIARANVLLAGAGPTDVPNHVHYDLKLHDLKGKVTTGTYDVYRDPMISSRADVVAGAYKYTVIQNFIDHHLWISTSGERPLELLDFEELYLEPMPAIDRLMAYRPPPRLVPQQVNGAPLLCASDETTTNLCFDPLIHVYAYAQLLNQTVIYSDWQTVGTHTAAATIRIWDGKRLMVEADGRVEEVKKFPPTIFVAPGDAEPAPDAEKYKIIKYGRVHEVDVYGNALIHVQVDEKGRVTKAQLIDADDKELKHIALEYAKGTRYEPYLVNGQPTPFETTLLFHNFPLEGADQ